MEGEGTSGAAAELLSFLIADIRGYTSFTQSRGDEAAAALAGKFALVAREGIEAHGGRLLELRGDEALAVFSSARASLRAAVALQEVFVDETRLEPDLPLTVGIGLDAGEVVAVEGGYRGGALNRAARLCSLAKAGEALASEGVTHLVGAVEGVTVAEWGTAEVKGFAEPVRAFTVTSSDGVGPVREFVTLSMVPSMLDSAVPMIGRDVELRQLSWAWRTARRGHGQVAVVRGPSGIGKTRLLSAVAEVAVAGGGAARFFTLAAAEPDLDGLRKALAAESGPVLVAVDDLDAGAQGVAEVFAEAGSLGGRPVLAVLALDEEHATDEDVRAVRGLNAGLDVGLRPLDPESVRRVAALYLESVAELPAGLLEATGGVPRRLHQSVASWAEDRATRRLGLLASQAAGSRSEVAVVEFQLAGTVADLQQVRERARLYGLGPGRHGPAPDRSPYLGLESFGPEDAEGFFGRERLVADLVARVAGGGLVGVVGPSGSGKSSLVRAGLVPALAAGVLPESDRSVTVVMRPGEHPAQALNAALLPALPPMVAADLTGGDPLLVQLSRVEDVPHVVVVVDQAEELFTVCSDEAERAGFVDGLVAAAADPGGRIDVVLTVRADYYGRFAGDQRLATAIAANQVLVGPMTAEEYRRAITRPAQRHGVTVEPELVDALVDEVTGQPGALPLLSTALVELWEARTDRSMTQASYRATGGLHGAVARLAESVYGALDGDQQQAARRMFLRLTGPGAGDTVVKRRIRLTDLALDDESSALVDLLARRRLITIDEGAVEVAHEALLREWPRFTDWLEEDREGIRLRAQLGDAAESWQTGGRDEGELYRGARLNAALDWNTEHHQDLTHVEQEFVTASTDEAQRVTNTQRRTNRRLRGLLAGVAVFLVAAVVAGLLAVRQGDQAQKNADTADARAAGARALTTDDIDESILLAVAGARLAESPDTTSNLLAALAQRPQLIASHPYDGDTVTGLDVSPDGRRMAVYDRTSHVRLYDTSTYEELARSDPVSTGVPYRWIAPLAFSPDGSTLAVALPALTPHPLQLLDGETLEPLAIQPGQVDEPSGIMDVAFSADGTTVAVVRQRFEKFGDFWDVVGASIVVWRTSAPRRPLLEVPLRLEDDSQRSQVAVSPDGDTVYTSLPLMAYDVASGQELYSPPPKTYVFGTGQRTNTFDLSPDGRVLAAAEEPDHLLLIDARTGVVRRTLVGHGESVLAVRFSHDGKLVATTSPDQTAIIWNVSSGRIRDRFTLGERDAQAVAFSPDDSTLYTAGADRAVREWDLEGTRRFLSRLRAPEDLFGHLVPTHGGRFILEWIGLVYGFRFLDLTTGNWSPVREEGLANLGGNLSPAGDRYLSYGEGYLHVWDPDGPRLVKSRTVSDELVSGRYSPDGSRIALVTTSGRVSLVDADSLEPVGRAVQLDSTGLDSTGGTVALGPDNRTALLLVPGYIDDPTFQRPSRKWTIVDLESGRVVRSGTMDFDTDGLAASPDGSHAAISGTQGEVAVLDLATGRLVRPQVRGHSARVWSITYSEDGSRFVTTALDGTANLWDGPTGRLLATVGIPERDYTAAAFTDAGTTVVIASNAGSVYLWDTRLEHTVDFGCRMAGRDLTEAEWTRQFGDRPFQETCPS